MYYLSFILFCCVNCSDSELSEVFVVVVVCFLLLEVEGQMHLLVPTLEQK